MTSTLRRWKPKTKLGMASSIVDLIIRARDQASGTIKGVAGATGSLSNSIAAGIIKANLFGAAMEAIGNAASFMMGKFEEAKKIQLDTVSAAGTFAALTGESYKESEKFVTSFGAELSKIAGALPGATADYQRVANSIMDNVIPAFKDANGVLNKGEFQKNLTDITKQMTLLGISSGTEAGAVGMFTARLLDGNIASAKNLLFADNNPAFINLLEQEMQKRGKTLNDMKIISAKERIEVVKAVSGKLVTKDVIDAASNTVDGLIAGIQSSLFDPTSGVFGLLRDLSTADGQQNVMTAVASSIKALQGFFDAGASILKALGVPDIDPMLVLYNGINTFTDWVKQASVIATLIAKTISGTGGGLAGFQVAAEKFLDPKRLMAGVDYLFSIVGTWITEGFAKISQFTQSLFAGGKGMVGGFVVGEKIGAFAAEFLGKIVSFVINLPWGDILISIGNVTLIVGSAIVGALWGFYTKAQEVTLTLWGQLGGMVVSGMNDLWTASSYTVSEWLSSFLGGWGEVGSFALGTVQNFFSQLGQAIADLWNRLIATIMGAVDGVVNQVKSAVSNPVGSAGSAIASAGQSAFNFGQNLASSLMGGDSSTPAISSSDVSRLAQTSVSNSKIANTTFAPVFNVSGVSNPEAIASMAIDQLDVMFRQRQEAVLVP
ncbi:hypothetical protein LC593_10730 [Nostoc sp. CHAB 5844]|nr:hypothetical protein [Nostoc sp. CHAB 5844]